jgi:ComEC/Rec2-related protein
MKPGRTPLLWISLCFAGGVWCASWHLLPLPWPGWAAAVSGTGSWFCRGRRGLLLLGAASWFAAWFYAGVRLDIPPRSSLASRFGDQPQSLELELSLSQFPQRKKDESGQESLRFEADARAVYVDGIRSPASGKVACTLRNPDPAQAGLDCGHRIRVHGFLSRPDGPANPGAFDYRGWLEKRGVRHRFVFEGRDCRTLLSHAPNPLIEASNRLRRHMLKVLAWGVETDAQMASLTSAMLFGYRGLEEEVEEAFRATGTVHLFAVSGQNVAIVLAFFILLLRVAGFIPWRWGWCLLLPLTLFCLTTGSQPSAVRAVCMAGMILIGWFIGRPPNLLNAAGATVLACLLWDPRQLLDLGFQLSFLVVLGLAGLSLPLYENFYRPLAPDPWIPVRLLPRRRLLADRAAKAFCLVFASSLVAWLCSAPLILWHFSLLAPVTLPANILVVPLASGVVYVSTLSVLASLLLPFVSSLFNQVNWLLLKALLAAVMLLSRVPGGHFYLPVHSGAPGPGRLHMACLDAGTTAPTLLRFSGHNLLLDSGSRDGWKYASDPARRFFGINRWDAVFLTQASSAHLGGGMELARLMPAEDWIEAGRRSKSAAQHQLLDLLQERDIPKTFLRRGDRWSRDALAISCLWPPAGSDRARRLEDMGLVLMIEFHNRRILWAGDISSESESALLGLEPHLSTDILIQGEHSAGHNLSAGWIRQLRPAFLVRPGRGYYPDRSLTPQLWRLADELGMSLLLLDASGAVTFDIGSSEDPILYSSFKRPP